MMDEGSISDSVACCMQVGQGNPRIEENDKYTYEGLVIYIFPT
jgi:hypothetical protein